MTQGKIRMMDMKPGDVVYPDDLQRVVAMVDIFPQKRLTVLTFSDGTVLWMSSYQVLPVWRGWRGWCDEVSK